MTRVLLHTCCGPCASACAETLRSLGHDVTLFFSNGNVWPPEEYVKRLESVKRLSEEAELPLLQDTHDHAAWLQCVAGMEGAPEGGERCRHCFRFNLERTQNAALAHGFARFTTSLTVSPHKCSRTLFAVGREIDPLRFLAVDFKSNGGYQRSLELSRRYSLYRQRFCGCEFGGGG
jgi:predicted adenine nucleotide alpha hydrolase (AANH) superfamily ATPase